MNVGENKGHRMQVARSRFAAMLIHEARDVSGLNFRQLDEALGLEEGYSRRYSLFPKKCRAPQAARLQDMENRIAKLLRRSAHLVVLEDDTKVIGPPAGGLNVRENGKFSLWLTYADNWPTYDCLRDHREPGLPITIRDFNHTGEEPRVYDLVERRSPYEGWPPMLRLYAWQWGVLWDKGLPWLTREAFGVAPSTSVDVFLPVLLENAKAELAHCRKGQMTASFYCGPEGPDDLDYGPPDTFFQDFDARNDADAAAEVLPEICRNGVVIYCDFVRRRVMNSLVESGDGR
ncbi:hypothetical protein AAKU55_005625 [Oxalobacteraceae bacterium GrIS 1.11]